MKRSIRDSVLAVTMVAATLGWTGSAFAALEMHGSPRAALSEPVNRLKLTPPGYEKPGAPAFTRLPNVRPMPKVETIAFKRPDVQGPHKAWKNVPEFDGKSTGAALALVLGGALVMLERRRRQSAV